MVKKEAGDHIKKLETDTEVCGKSTRGNGNKLQQGKVWLKEKAHHSDGDEVLEPVAQRSWEIFIFRDFQKSTGHNPQQPDLTLKLLLLRVGGWTRRSPESPSNINTVL